MAMRGTLTVRLPASALRSLRRRARASGATPSAFIRELLVRELGGEEPGKTALELSRRWVGKVRRGEVIHGRDARAALKDWNPDRRG